MSHVTDPAVAKHLVSSLSSKTVQMSCLTGTGDFLQDQLIRCDVGIVQVSTASELDLWLSQEVSELVF